MREALNEWLIVNGHAIESDKIHFSARLCGNWSIQCFVNDDLRYFVKIQCFDDIKPEFEALKLWHHYLPQSILKPFYFGPFEGTRLYLQQAASHQTLTKENFFKHPFLSFQLSKYFFRLSQLTLKQKPMIESKCLESFQADLPNEYLSEVASCFNYQIQQHGDLTLNNLGITEKQLWIFDWEDYGKSSWPLLDLTVFVMSLYNFNAQSFMDDLSDHQFVSWLGGMVGYFDITLEQFIYCLPYSLAVFSDLKKKLGYGEEVVLRTNQAIREMSSMLQGVICA